MSTDISSTERLLSDYDLYDAEIVAHGFLPHMRDYRLLVERLDAAPLGLFEYVFRGCMEARYAVTLPPRAISMDDRLLDPNAADAPSDAFRWAVRSACSAEEGVMLSVTSQGAIRWTERLGRPMFEIVIGTNVYRLELVFHELVIHPAQSGRETEATT